MFKYVLIQSPALFKVKDLQVLATFADHAQILIFEISSLLLVYSLKVMVSLVSSMHRLKQRKSFRKEHFTS